MLTFFPLDFSTVVYAYSLPSSYTFSSLIFRIIIDGSCMIWYPPIGYTWEMIPNERVLQRRFLKRHTDDVYDVAWSPDSRRVITGSVDNTCIVWDVARGKDITTLEGHSQFVQGVCWDPAGAYLVSQSNDRSVRVYFENSAIVAAAQKGSKALQRLQLLMAINNRSRRPYQCIQAIKSHTMEDDTNNSTSHSNVLASNTVITSSSTIVSSSTVTNNNNNNKHHIYLDENVQTFFRRPTWTPDGSLLLTPTGSVRENLYTAPKPTTYIFQRGKYAEPIAHLPCASSAKPSIAVRASPVLYRLRKNSDGTVPSNGLYNLPYRCIFAIATLDAVMIYDTQNSYPIACAANLHLCNITDIAWSSSGLTLFISSIDGYCSLISFDSNDLGEKLSVDDPSYPVFLRDRKHEQVFVAPPTKKSKVSVNNNTTENIDTNNTEGITVSTPTKGQTVSIVTDTDDTNNNTNGMMDKLMNKNSSNSTTITMTSTTSGTQPPAKRKATLTLIAPLGVDILPPSVPVTVPVSSSLSTSTTSLSIAAENSTVISNSNNNNNVISNTVVPMVVPTALPGSAASSLTSGGVGALASVLAMMGK